MYMQHETLQLSRRTLESQHIIQLGIRWMRLDAFSPWFHEIYSVAVRTRTVFVCARVYCSKEFPKIAYGRSQYGRLRVVPLLFTWRLHRRQVAINDARARVANHAFSLSVGK